MRYKRKLNISSLGAAICNVAVFKGMKERQFKDEIHISYTEEGVILEAANQNEWERANKYVQNFLNNKKIALLAFGFEKEVYEELILKGLKDYTRKMKEHGEECPYINIIHYQKLRKSCEYMDKERYVEPLKDWERKSKKNPNFAFLIVEPIYKFEEVKRNLLQFLLKKEIPLQQREVSCIYFLLLFFSSNIKEDIKEAFDKKYLELAIELNVDYNPDNKEEQFEVRINNYTNLNLNQLDYQIVSYSKHLPRLGLQFIPSKQIEKQIKNTRGILTNSVTNFKGTTLTAMGALQSVHQQLIKQYGDDYCVIPFKKSERQKYSAVISKFVNASSQKTIEELSQQIEKNIICIQDDIQFLGQVNPVDEGRGYRMHKVCINSCPFLLYQYQNIALNELETFLMYIEQLRTYYCTYLVRFYGISIRYGNFMSIKGQVQMPASMTLQQKIQQYTFYLIFDYHHRTLHQMTLSDMIVDNFQIGQIALQILYLANFLHTHQEPRALGSLRTNQIYWPLRVVLPYLRNNDEGRREEREKGYFSALGQGFEGDVKIVGEMIKELMELGEEPRDVEDIDDHLGDLLRLMLKDSKYERIALPKCIAMLQELLLQN